MKAYISAGGKGTRFLEITHDEIPKPMAPMLGKPILEYAVDVMKKNGVDEIFFSVGHLHQKIEEYFGDGKKFGLKINYILEDTPLSSGGALYYLKDKVDGDFIVANGDVIFDIDIKRMLDFHKGKGALITLLTQPTNHPHDCDLIILDKTTKRVLGFDKKNQPRAYDYFNQANLGFFIINKEALKYFKELKPVGMEHDFINFYIQNTDKVFGYESSEYIQDVGTPERYTAALKDIESKVVNKRCLTNPQKAVFLSAEVLTNKDIKNIAIGDKFTDNIINCFKQLRSAGFLIIATDDKDARESQELEAIYKNFSKRLGESGVFFDDYFYYDTLEKNIKLACEKYSIEPKTSHFLARCKNINLNITTHVVSNEHGTSDIIQKIIKKSN
ncbi:MAG: nucleotidyltransferase family protein [Christensenellaceae bacterium]|jgi:NDP-sugar pyrophosphorylase family protein|nr:nucleotidyltransferase family protein [Christensenellaceae bacterium]